jgi:hypothetical protein
MLGATERDETPGNGGQSNPSWAQRRIFYPCTSIVCSYITVD